MYEVDQYTVSLLHFDDGIKDETGKVWTANGSPVISEAQSKIGEKSLFLDGSSYLTTPSSSDFDFGSEDFTIDWWEYRTDITNLTGMVFQASGYYTLHVGSLANGNVNCAVSSNGSSWNLFGLISLGTVDLNTWNHFAFVRKGSNFYGFKNGHLISTATSNLAIANKGKPTYIGCCINDSMQVSYYFNGYIDEFRVSKGIARWTENFDPTASVTAPTNLTATAGNSQVTLSWTAVEGATSYIVKRSTTAGGEYITIANGVTDASYIDKSVTNGTTYYYVVVAVKGDLVSSNSNEASATPVGDGKALLCVTMIDSSEREYQLSTAEIDAFINWFSRTVGTGTTCYVLNKNVGVHNSKEYLAFEKIISFEVTEL